MAGHDHSQAQPPGAPTGLIGLFVRHPTAANLLMILTLALGVAALARINTQFFPTTGLDIISISVTWPGATAEDVDLSIVQELEPELRFIDGLSKLEANAREGGANITMEFESGTDMQEALANVETAVSLVTTLPDEAEEPEIQRAVFYDTVMRLVISGPFSEDSLAAWGRMIRDDLLAEGVDQIEFFGRRAPEIAIEIEPEVLRRYD